MAFAWILMILDQFEWPWTRFRRTVIRAMEMGNAGRDLVLKRFNWEVEGRKLVEFYDNLAVR